MMKKYSITVATLTADFVALDDRYAFDAVVDILQRKAFRDIPDNHTFQLVGPDGPVKGGHGTMGDIRGRP